MTTDPEIDSVDTGNPLMNSVMAGVENMAALTKDVFSGIAEKIGGMIGIGNSASASASHSDSSRSASYNPKHQADHVRAPVTPQIVQSPQVAPAATPEMAQEKAQATVASLPDYVKGLLDNEKASYSAMIARTNEEHNLNISEKQMAMASEADLGYNAPSQTQSLKPQIAQGIG